jgi:hypothetical protein
VGVDDDAEREWAELRRPYWSERVELWGRPEDYVGLVQTLVQEDRRGVPGALEAAQQALHRGCERHPSAVLIWELVVAYGLLTGRDQEVEEALVTIQRLDPANRVLHDIRQEQGSREYVNQVNHIRWQLYEQMESSDLTAREAAVAEFATWARNFPTNSTFVLDYALGLQAIGRKADAHRVALSAMDIEDGSFVDAFHIGTILLDSEHQAQAQDMLRRAVARAADEEQRANAERALARAIG